MAEAWQWIVALVGLATWIYFYFKSKYSYWDRLGIPGPKPIWLVGNVTQRMFADLRSHELKWVLEYGKVYGCFLGLQPALTVAEPELIKQMLIKDFHYFTNRIEIQAYHELWSIPGGTFSTLFPHLTPLGE